MSLNLKQVFGASLLALAVVGGVSTSLSNTLYNNTSKVTLVGVVTEQPQNTVRHAEVIVTEGRAS